MFVWELIFPLKNTLCFTVSNQLKYIFHTKIFFTKQVSYDTERNFMEHISQRLSPTNHPANTSRTCVSHSATC